MPQVTGCLETVDLLNVVFQVPFVFNDGHEILARLQAGDSVVDIVQGMNQKLGRPAYRKLIDRLGAGWPALHQEAIARMVEWALEKLDTDDRVLIQWRGDANYKETVTKFELREQLLTIEFAHPPGVLAGA